MSAKTRQEIHVNSLLAFAEGKEDLFSKREIEILRLLRSRPKGNALTAMTDREIMIALGYSDPNAVRPRLTELIAEGVVVETGSVTDQVTGKTVRVVELAPDPRRPQMEFSFV